MLTPDSKPTNSKNISDDPQYFGAYLNMARHNVFLIVNHMAEKFKDLHFKKLPDDSDIMKEDKNILLQVFDKDYEHHKDFRDGVYHYLKRFMPLVKIFNPEDWPKSKKKENIDELSPEARNKIASQEIKFEELHRFLSLGFSELSKLRDSYTHYFAFDNKTKNEVPRKIDLDKSIKEDVNLLFKYAPQYSFFNFESTQKGVEDTHKPEDFEHLAWYKLYESESNNLTPQGLFFFICLFLEKSYAFKFLKKFNGFKNENISPFKATLKTFTSYSIKLPHEKLISDNPKQVLLLDMLNELNKCPRELFEHLTPEDRKEFEPQLGEDSRNEIILNSISEDIDENAIDDFIKEITYFKRRQDRFPYFALRFLDEKKTFDKIRFHIRLGKLLMDQYSKSILNIETNRKIHKEVNAFGRLGDFLDEENVLKKIVGEKKSNILFEQFAPHYNIVNNKIGLYLSEERDEIHYPSLNERNTISSNKPTVFLSVHELPKLVLLELLREGESQKTIMTYVKTLQFSLYNQEKLNSIRDKTTYEPETFSRRLEDHHKMYKGVKLREEQRKRKEYGEYLMKRREVLDVAIGGKIKTNQLPSKLQNYLMRIEDAAHHKLIHHKVKELKFEIKERKYELGKGKAPKIGVMATFIAKDIINMIADEAIKKKITSAYYNKLQNKLAYFGAEKETVIALCEELGIFIPKRGHVFLTNALLAKSSSVLEIYQSYLDAKAKWIDSTFTKKEHGKTIYFIPDNKAIPYIFLKYKGDGFDFQNWLKQKSSMPIDLPTTLFDDKIAELLKDKLKEKGIQFKEKERFALLLGKNLNNDSQPFYSYTRQYYTSKKEVETFSTLKLASKELKKRYGKTVEETEKTIRFTQTKDRIIKLLCETLIKEDSSLQLDDAVLLKNFHPKSEHNPLDAPIIFKQKIHSKTILAKDSKKSEEDVKQWLLLPEAEKNKTPTAKKWYRWTVKDFGTFKKLLTDKRLQVLFEYFEEDEIPFSIIEHELKEYDKYREKIFDKIFDVEKAIIRKDKTGLMRIAEDKIYPEVQFNKYITWLSLKGLSADKEMEKLITSVRNSFSHSQIPGQKTTHVPILTKQAQEEFDMNCDIKGYKENYFSVCKQIYQKYDAEILQIIEKINT